MSKKIPNSIFSKFGNAMAMINHGRTERMRNKALKEVREVERDYPDIAVEYSKWQQSISKMVSKFKKD